MTSPTVVTSAYSLVLLLVLRRTIAGNIAGNTGDAFGKAQPIWLPRHSSITPAVTGAPQNKYASAEWALFRLAVPRFARTQVPLTSLMIAITAAQTNDKLLGSYKLWVNGKPLANGPGRNVHCAQWNNATNAAAGCAQVAQGYDVVNATTAALLLPHRRRDMNGSSSIIVAVQCYSMNAEKNAGLLASVVAIYADATTQRFDTTTNGSKWLTFNASAAFGKSTWNVTTGPPKEGGMYDTPQENLDHRFWPGAEWRDGAMTGSAQWAPPGAGNPRLATGAPLHRKEAAPVMQFTAAAVRVTEVRVNGTANGTVIKGRYLVDLGGEVQGGLTLVVPAVAVVTGSVIEVRLAEALLNNGSVRFCTSAGPQYIEHWTMGHLTGADTDGSSGSGSGGGGGGDNVFDFGQEYKEFRWAEVLGWPVDTAGALTTANVGAWIVRYPLGSQVLGDLVVERTAAGTSATTTQTSAVEAHSSVGGHGPPTFAPTFVLPTVWPPLLPGGDEKWGSFASSDPNLDEVFKFTRFTIATTSLDVNTDSNTRQRDNCMIDAFVAAMGQFALTGEVELQRRTLEFALLKGFAIHPGWTEDKLVVVFGALQLLRYDADAATDGHGNATRSTALRLLKSTYGALSALSFGKYFVEREALVVKGCPTWEKQVCGVEGATCAHCEPDLVDYPAQYSDGFRSPHNRSVVTNSYVISVLAALASIATALDNVHDAAMWSARSARVKQALLTATFVNATSGLFLDGKGANHSALPSQFFPPCHGVFPTVDNSNTSSKHDDNEVTPDVTAMLDLIENKTSAARGREPACSCFGAHWLLQGLYHIAASVAGPQGERAAELALQFMTSEYTWLQMLRQGATATMEVWTKNDKPNLSFSHPWCSAPANAIPRFLLGLAPTSAGWGTYSVRPQIGSLAHAAGILRTSIGSVRINVRQTATTVTLSVTVPSRGAVTLCLPPPSSSSSSSARWALKLDGEVIASVLRGRLLCASKAVVGGGSYVLLLTSSSSSS